MFNQFLRYFRRLARSNSVGASTAAIAGQLALDIFINTLPDEIQAFIDNYLQARRLIRSEYRRLRAHYRRRANMQFQIRFVQNLGRQSGSVVAELRRRVPRRTGRLANSAEAKVVGSKFRMRYAADYAFFVYYRKENHRSRTVRQTLAKYRRSAHYRYVVGEAQTAAKERTLVSVRRELEAALPQQG